MRVAIEAQRLFRPHKYGMDIVAYELLRRLPVSQDRHEYHVLVKDDSDKCITHKGSRTVHTMQTAPYAIWEQALLPQYCNKVKADVLHCTASTAPLQLKQPLVLTLHDVIFLEQSYDKASWYQRLGKTYRSTIIHSIVRNAERIITVSEYQKNIIAEKLSVPREKISVIYNGVDDRFFINYSEEKISVVLRKYKLSRGYIFFMANTDPRKNTAGVLQAYSMLIKQHQSAPRLVIKGLNTEQLREHLEHEKLGHLINHIDLIGYVDYNDLPLIYQGASMLWFPSFSEGFGLPIIEAMAGGVPVITSNLSCMPEIAGDAALFINPYQPQTITDAAIKIISDKATASYLSQRGKGKASFFTWDNAARQLVQVYNEIEQTI